jgi:hypothetical protein
MRILHPTLAATLLLALAACGGGGSEPTMATPATADAVPAEAATARALAAPARAATPLLLPGATVIEEGRRPPVLPPALANTQVYFTGKLGSRLGMQLTYRPDGSARVVTTEGVREATWRSARALTTVTLATPFSTVGYTNSPIDGLQRQVKFETTGYRFQQLPDALGGAQRGYSVASRETILDGPTAGTVTDHGWSAALTVRSALDTALTRVTEADFAPGMRLGGVVSRRVNAPASFEVDVVEFTGPATARFKRDGELLAWAVREGRLVLSSSAGEFSYAPLQDPATNTDTVGPALVTEIVAGQAVGSFEMPLSGVESGPAFPTGGALARRWESGLSAGFFMEFAADGTGRQVSVSNGVESAQAFTWVVGGDGHLRMTRGSASNPITREWQLLARSGAGLAMAVLERQTTPGNPLFVPWRINTWTAASSALAPAPPGLLQTSTGELFPLRVNFSVSASTGLITGGAWDFHKIAGTLTPCTATAANTGPNAGSGSCVGVNSFFTTTSQGGPLSLTGSATAIALSGGDGGSGFGYQFTGTLVGRVWTGVWAKAAADQFGPAESGNFSVEVVISP